MILKYGSLTISKILRGLVLACALISLSGCTGAPPPDTLSSGTNALKVRQLQSKKFDTLDEPAMLTASMEVLQDMGFMIKEAESKLGVIVGSKHRETDNRGQRMALIALSIMAGDGSLRGIEQSHHIRVSLVTIPDKTKKNTTVRINFQRQVFDMEGHLVRLETLQEPELYQGFFTKLSKSVFLEAHEI